MPVCCCRRWFAANVALAVPTELVSNGGFETGALGPWSTSGIAGGGPCPAANQDWNVSNSGAATQCLAVGNPAGSNFAAYVMNDGTGPLTYRLFESLFVPLGTNAGTLSFDWESNNPSDANRNLAVLLNGNTVFNSSTGGVFGWTPVSVDVTALLAAAAGTNITLEFQNFIPATWTGAAGMGLDNVSIVAQVPEPGRPCAPQPRPHRRGVHTQAPAGLARPTLPPQETPAACRGFLWSGRQVASLRAPPARVAPVATSQNRPRLTTKPVVWAGFVAVPASQGATRSKFPVLRKQWYRKLHAVASEHS